MPLEKLESYLAELPRDKEIIAYCRGLFCILADKAVELLTNMGYQARRLDAGLVDWRDAGLPMA